jgi:hypothetical protein
MFSTAMFTELASYELQSIPLTNLMESEPSTIDNKLYPNLTPISRIDDGEKYFAIE